MDRHPGGKAATLRLLNLAQISAGMRIIDLGAGSGESVSMLVRMGADVLGIDLNCSGGSIRTGNMCVLDYEDESFDAALAECSLSVCGDLSAAIAESARILKTGGKLLISDVFYKEMNPGTSFFPCALSAQGFKKKIQENGFEILYFEDISETLREYYIELIWRGEERELKSSCLGYFMMVCMKGV